MEQLLDSRGVDHNPESSNQHCEVSDSLVIQNALKKTPSLKSQEGAGGKPWQPLDVLWSTDLLDFIVKGGTHQSFGTRPCSSFHALWNCTQPFIPTSSNQSKNPEHQQVSTDHHSRSSGYTPLEMFFDSPQQGIEVVYGWSFNMCAAPWNKKARLSRVNDVLSNGASHPAMASSTNFCRYNREHQCKFAHNKQLETPNSHLSSRCPVNPLSFHQKHKVWLHRQQLRTKIERSHRGCGMLSTPWTILDACKLKHHCGSNFCTSTNVFKKIFHESRPHNLPPWSLDNLSGRLGVLVVVFFNVYSHLTRAYTNVWTVPSWVVCFPDFWFVWK